MEITEDNRWNFQKDYLANLLCFHCVLFETIPVPYIEIRGGAYAFAWITANAWYIRHGPQLARNWLRTSLSATGQKMPTSWLFIRPLVHFRGAGVLLLHRGFFWCFFRQFSHFPWVLSVWPSAPVWCFPWVLFTCTPHYCDWSSLLSFHHFQQEVLAYAFIEVI